jgi:hypothetical protein
MDKTYGTSTTTYIYDYSLQMDQTQICEILVSGQVMGLSDLKPNKRYDVIRAQELYMCGSGETCILLHIWEYISRDVYVLLPRNVLPQADLQQINNYERMPSLIYRGVDPVCNSPIVVFS